MLLFSVLIKTVSHSLFMLLAAALISTAYSAQTVRSLEDISTQIEQTTQQLKALQQQQQSISDQRKQLNTALTAVESNRLNRAQRLQDISEQITTFNQTLEALDRRLRSNQQRTAQYRNSLATGVRNIHQTTMVSSDLRLLLQHEDTARARRLSTYRDYLVSAQQQSIEQQLQFLTEIEAARLSTLKERNWLNHIERKVSEQHNALSLTAEQQRLQIRKIDEKFQRTAQQVSSLLQDQQRLQQLFEELETLQNAGSGYFEALKGEYRVPVSGPLKARFGDAKSIGKLRWSGWFISAEAGTPVSAIADGEIIYSDWLQGFGLLVIVDHGDGYTSLYAGNRSVAHDIGSWVESGATIATVGDSGGQNTNGLYFEIRHNAQALDPSEWLEPLAQP